MERRRVRYVGRVQGVGFRATARGLAGSRDLTGWVRNEPDGSVTLVIQGEPERIDECLDALREHMGPAARPASTETLGVDPDEHAFEVRS